MGGRPGRLLGAAGRLLARRTMHIAGLGDTGIRPSRTPLEADLITDALNFSLPDCPLPLALPHCPTAPRPLPPASRPLPLAPCPTPDVDERFFIARRRICAERGL